MAAGDAIHAPSRVEAVGGRCGWRCHSCETGQDGCELSFSAGAEAGLGWRFEPAVQGRVFCNASSSDDRSVRLLPGGTDGDGFSHSIVRREGLAILDDGR